MQLDDIRYNQQKGILVEAWSPLGSGAVLKDETLAKIAAKYNKSVAQLCIRLSLDYVLPCFRQFLFTHLSVGNGNDSFRDNVMDFCRNLVYILNLIMKVKDLTCTAKLLFYCLTDYAHVVFKHVCLHRMSVYGRFFKHRHIAYSHKCHIEGSGYGGCREGKHVNLL